MYDALAIVISEALCRMWHYIEAQALYQDYQLCVYVAKDWEATKECLFGMLAGISDLGIEYAHCL